MQRFKGTRTPTTDFGAVQSDLQTTPLFLDVNLSVARSLAAGTALDLPINGNVLYIDQKADSGFATIHFNDDARAGNTPFTVFPGWVARVPYIKLIIENEAQPGQVMRLIYGVDLDFQPAVSAGVFGQVSVVDGAKARTLLGIAFAASAEQVATSAKYSLSELWNDAGSDSALVVEKFICSSPTAGNLYIGLTATRLLTSVTPGISKLSGGADSAVATARVEALAGLLSPNMMYMSIAANVPLIFELRDPIVVLPGFGLVAQAGAVNVTLGLVCEFFQEGL